MVHPDEESLNIQAKELQQRFGVSTIAYKYLKEMENNLRIKDSTF